MKERIFILLGPLAAVALLSPASLGQNWSENFDSYTPGQLPNGVPCVAFRGWDGSAAATGDVVAGPALSGPNSLNVNGFDDNVLQPCGVNDGQWSITADWWIPSAFTGQTYFILQNTYNEGGPYNWSAQFSANGGSGMLADDGAGGASLPLVFDAWVQVRVDIDFDANTQTVYYGGQLFYTGSWTEHVSGGGALEVGGLNLFSSGGSDVYWDNVHIYRTPCTQSTDPNTILPLHSLVCDGPPQTDNMFLRFSDPVLDCGASGTSDLFVECVRFGIQEATAGPTSGGTQPANVRVYSTTVPPAGGGFLYADLTLEADVALTIADQTSSFMTVPVNAVIPAGAFLVLEVAIPNAVETSDKFRIGSNDGGQTGGSYIAAPLCALLDPFDLAGAGFPEVHYVLDAVVTEFLEGNDGCPTNPNSTGLTGNIAAVGSASTVNNDAGLFAYDLPPDQFGYFLASDFTIVHLNPGGSAGNLCIGPMNPINLGRFADLIQSTGPSGSISIALNANAIPIAGGPEPNAPVTTAMMPGVTWYFQCWHRDIDPSTGAMTSNFTDRTHINWEL